MQKGRAVPILYAKLVSATRGILFPHIQHVIALPNTPKQMFYVNINKVNGEHV